MEEQALAGQSSESGAHAAVPSWQSMLWAIAVAAVTGSALDLTIQFWRAPLGWSAGLLVGFFIMTAIAALLVASAMGFTAGLPLGRLLARMGRFKPAILVVGGALLGALTAIIFSALGANSYEFMSGLLFWISFAEDCAMGAIAGYVWWVFEKLRLRRA